MQEQRVILKETKMRANMIVEENQLKTMDPCEMDEKAREPWEVRLCEILRSRTTWLRVMDSGVLASGGGGSGAWASGCGGGGDGSNCVA
jgi:hypothetical protein